ncbi:hypothetical protein PR202_ga07236 [Eleusine coracana subsp. coracana]|uniref:1-phosphatidylinositol 4-kinase n=1 Tax=Eleusine coracana subsp. coracana TaxID=191504 RepID=A0AAV5BY13_ELECO|nr:hypothetical protein PR202_ga07236 [Eleusine coracana subsp. coracana]
MSSAGVDALSPLLEQQLALVPQCFLRSRPPPDSILIFLAMSGAPPVPMRVQGSESVASVKLRIQRLKFTGFVATKQRLVFGGHELSHGRSLLRDYGLDEGNVLHLVVRLADLRAITIETNDGKKFRFQVESGCKVGYLKDKLAARTGEQLTTLKDCKLVLDEEELEDDQLVTDIDFKGDAVIHLFIREPAKVTTQKLEKETVVTATTPKQKESCLQIDASGGRTTALVEPIIVNRKAKISPAVMDMIGMTIAGLENGFLPDMSTEGSGGVYFMKDHSGESNVAVFKPIDEEPMAENNPRGLPLSVDGEGLKRGTRVGEGALREVAALANADRHAGNILVCQDGNHLKLVPIDHGYCLPEKFEDCTFEWLYWPQAREPFSADALAYIRTLDAEKDIALLKFHGWGLSRQSALVLRASTMLLKKGAERGLTPYDIGSIMCRETVKKESKIEAIIEEAEDAILPGTSDATFLETISEVMDRHLHNMLSS